MITNSIGYQDAVKYDLSGLSGDDKPTKTYDGKKIANGSTFFEMDTQVVKFYDAEHDTWV
jgi:hypothetical protein